MARCAKRREEDTNGLAEERKKTTIYIRLVYIHGGQLNTGKESAGGQWENDIEKTFDEDSEGREIDRG